MGKVLTSAKEQMEKVRGRKGKVHRRKRVQTEGEPNWCNGETKGLQKRKLKRKTRLICPEGKGRQRKKKKGFDEQLAGEKNPNPSGATRLNDKGGTGELGHGGK